MAHDSAMPYLFASFSSSDIEVVDAFIGELDGLGISVWAAHRNLRPGQSWSEAIAEAVAAASGAIAFVSASTLQSGFARRELQAVLGRGKRVHLVTIGAVDKAALSALVGNRTILAAPERPSAVDVHRICLAVASALHADADWQAGGRLFDAAASANVATSMAAELEGAPEQSAQPGSETNAVFIVHGHDYAFLDEVMAFLATTGVEAVVLTRLGRDDQSLFQRFFRYGQKARFALALISADDMGVSCAQYGADGVGERALQFRARQNVILELGFFFGRLGWQNVFVLQKPPPKVYPNFERPSDLDGVVFNVMDGSGSWKGELVERLRKAGFTLKV
jgi:predicted nucleotide-binding protein